jgi:tetratricopeptide (TPR) repeat protein
VEPQPTQSWSHRRFVVLLLGAVVLIAAIAWQVRHTRRPEIPLPDLAEVDSEVVEAIERARDEIVRHPSSSAAWGQMGEVLRAHDFGSEANRCFAHAETLDPREPRWPYLQGLTLLLSEPQAGIECLERAATRCPNGPLGPRLRLAEALIETGRLDEAESHLAQAIAFDSNSARARLGLARLAIQRENWDEALKQLVMCQDDVHCRKLACTLQAEVWNRVGDKHHAQAEQRRMLELPEDERWPDPFVDEVLNLQRGLNHRLAQAGALRQANRVDEAIELLEQTLRRHPDSVEARLQLAEIWRGLGKLDQAEKIYLEATQTTPMAAEAWFGLGCMQAINRPREAVVSFRRAIELKPDHALAHFNLAHRLKELGDLAGAADEFRATLRCRPDYAPASKALAELQGTRPTKQ